MRDFITEVFRQSERGIPPSRAGYINNFWIEMEVMAPKYTHPPGKYAYGDLMEKGDTIFYHKAERERITRHCMALLDAVKPAGEVDDPFYAIDSVFKELVIFKLYPGLEEDVIVDRACDLLTRMPQFPVSLADIEPGHCSSEEWNRLSIVTIPSTNTVRLALAIAADAFWGPELPPQRPVWGTDRNARMNSNDWDPGILEDYVNGISQLLEEVAQLSGECSDEAQQRQWFIVKSFLWTSFQRGTMLLLWFILDRQLKWGYDWQRDSSLLSRIKLLAHKPIEKILEDLDAPLQSKYMCRWAYRSMRENHLTTALDVGKFHRRFKTLFGNRSGRCLPHGECCDGRSPMACQRYVGANIVDLDQSAHNPPCAGNCQRLSWDEESYRGVRGARAVCLTETNETTLKYKDTSEKTMAISHVWSHGQGGRPERVLNNGKLGGFNSCLHERYTKIAKRFDCDSYWMDTPCIPEDHQLRKESIANINKVFTQSCVTLVCDKDIMSIDVSPLLGDECSTSPAMLELRESIIATLLVCDWNVRSWTLLESMRGRQHIYLLFKHDIVLCLKTILDLVSTHGSIDIAILFLGSQHMLPAIRHDRVFDQPFGVVEQQASLGFIDKESAAALLSRRHASREGDEIVIWSLLASDKPYYNATDWWKSNAECFTMPTRMGFLVSSVPRIEDVEGLSWAPKKPGIYLGKDELDRKIYHPYVDQKTERANVWRSGLVGVWGVCVFSTTAEAEADPGPRLGSESEVSNSCNHKSTHSKIAELGAMLRGLGYERGVLLQPLENVWRGFKEKASRYRGCDGFLFGVCGSRRGEEVKVEGKMLEKWEWVGVSEWGLDEELPEFGIQQVLIS